MDGIFFLLGIVSIAVIVHWVIRNDKAGPGAPTTGLLAMSQEPVLENQASPPRPARPYWRPPGPGRAPRGPS